MTSFCHKFMAAYEAAAQEQAGKPLPHLHSGFWLQSYGFSKACLSPGRPLGHFLFHFIWAPEADLFRV